MSIDVGHHANPQHTLPACRIAWFERVRAPPNPSRASEFNDADLARSAPKRHLSLSLWPARPQDMVAGRQPHAHEGLGHRFGPRTAVHSQLDDVGGVGPPLAHHVHRQSLRRCGKPFGICLHRRRGHRCTGAGQLVARRLADPMAPCAIGICLPNWLGHTGGEEQRALFRVRSTQLGVPPWKGCFASDSPGTGHSIGIGNSKGASASRQGL